MKRKRKAQRTTKRTRRVAKAAAPIAPPPDNAVWELPHRLYHSRMVGPLLIAPSTTFAVPLVPVPGAHVACQSARIDSK